jgi:sugar phosphate isomerase/epimerase
MMTQYQEEQVMPGRFELSLARAIGVCRLAVACSAGSLAAALMMGLVFASVPAAGAQTDEKGYNPRVCVGLYAWVQDRSKKGTSLWDDLDAVFGEVRAAGFQAVEGFLGDFFGSDERAERTRQLVTKHKIVLAGLYTGGKLYEEDAGRKAIASIVEMAKRAKSYPNLFIDVNPDPLPGGAKKTDEQLATQVRMLNELGRQLKAMGMQLVIHQHAPEIHFGAREHRYNVQHVDPAVVGFCIDTDWFKRGGEDPIALTKETGRKIKAIHLRQGRDGVWTETLGPGDVDYEAIARYLKEIKFSGWLSLELAVEGKTKVTRGIVENHRLGREYLESVFLGGPGSGGSGGAGE